MSESVKPEVRDQRSAVSSDQNSGPSSDFGRIAVATRIGATPDAQFFRSWNRLISGSLRPGDQVMDPPIGKPHHFAADEIAATFLESQCDTLLSIDDDVAFPADTVERMRADPAGHPYDLLMALCPVRTPPHLPVVLRRNHDMKTGKLFMPGTDNGVILRYIPALDAINGGVVDVDMVGLGFTLIRRRVFDAMTPRLAVAGSYFQWGDVQQGEDCYFCEQAKDLGFRIGVHTGISVGHRVTVTVTWSAEKRKAVITS